MNSYENLLDKARQLDLTVKEYGNNKARIQTPGHGPGDDGTVAAYLDGKTLVHTFNGDTDETLSQLGLTLKDLYDDKPEERYTYPDGRVVHRGVRPDNPYKKTFYQDVPKTNKKEALYGSENITHETETVYVVEGEKDVNTVLAVFTAPAVSQAGGAGQNPNKADWSPLVGKKVLIVVDNDEPGMARGKAVYDHLRATVATKSLEVYKPPIGKDISDYALAHGTLTKKPLEKITDEITQGEKSILERVGIPGGKLDAMELPELEWTVPGLIPEGYGILVAPPKAGKSWLVAEIGLAVAAGAQALGAIPVTQKPVLYLALEDGPRRLQTRYRTLTQGAPIPEGIISVPTVSIREAWEVLEQFVQKYGHKKPLILVDTYQKVAPSKSNGTPSYEHDYKVGSKFKELVARMPGGTILAVHHTNKGEHDDWQDSVSGTNGIAGAADFTMVLKRKRKSTNAILQITGRDVEENEYALITEGGVWSLNGATLLEAADNVEAIREEEQRDTKLANQGDRTLEVLTFVEAKGAIVTPKMLVEEMREMSARAAATYLGRLVDRGLIEKVGRGEYRGK